MADGTRGDVPLWARVALFVAGYLACALVSRSIGIFAHPFLPLWLPSGLFLAILLRIPSREWPVFAAAGFAATMAAIFWIGSPLPITAVYSGILVLEAVSAAWLVRRLVIPHPRLTSVREVIGIFAVAIVTTMASATLGAGAVDAIRGTASFAQAWPLWWSADAVGVILMAPIGLVAEWPRAWPPLWRNRRSIEVAGFLITLLATILYVFQDAWNGGARVNLFLVPVVVWAALRFGVGGAAFTNAALGLAGAWSTAQGTYNPRLIDDTPAAQTVALLSVILVLAPTGLCLAAIVAERQRAAQDLVRSQRDLQALSRRLVDVQEESRRELARELHDRIGQNLTALNLSLAIMQGQLSQESLDRVRGRFDDTLQVLTDAMAHVRDVMADLRPPLLEEYGLGAALRSYASRAGSRAGLQVHVDAPDDLPRYPGGVETALYRIAQEAITNVARHAQAGEVRVAVSPSGAGVRLSVVDDGVGFDGGAKSASPGWGITLMRERAEAVGARFELTSIPREGTTVDITWIPPAGNGGPAGLARS